MLRSMTISGVLIVLGGAALAQEAAPQPLVVHPAVSDQVIFNPGMGLYVGFPPDNVPDDHWMLSLADIFYERPDWSRLNPEEGVYTFHDYFGPLWEKWVEGKGKRVAFRVMSESMHSRTKYVTPEWVFEKGVPGVKHTGIHGQEQVDPVFWDDRYLDLNCEFVRRLGEYLDGREGIEFVDIGSIGEWGEMHLGQHIPGRWTPEQLEETGFSRTRYIEAYRRVIDTFAEAFPHTPVFLNVGGPQYLTIMDYAASRGINFRQDGLTPSGASADVGGWLYGPYSRRGVKCNFEFFAGYEDMVRRGWDLRATIDKGLEAPISYLHANLGVWWTHSPDILRTELTRAALKVGYRLVPDEVTTRNEVRVSPGAGGRLPISSTWTNAGVAPPYQSLAVDWFLVGADGGTAAEGRAFPITPTTQWWGGSTQTVDALIHVPADLPLGDYTLKVAGVLPETGQRIRLGIEGEDAETRYDLCNVRAVAGQAEPEVVYTADFEGTETDWRGTEGMGASVDQGDAHSGSGSLLVTGTQPLGWNYAGIRVPEAAQPWAVYHLSAWMKVDELDPARFPPYVKIGINDADGNWITNFGSGKYDTHQMGTWQRLEVVAEMPPRSASIDIAIEKGANDIPVRTRLRLDDVRLEITEGL